MTKGREVIRVIKNVRIDESLWQEAKIAAIRQGIDLQDWIAEAIQEKLKTKRKQ